MLEHALWYMDTPLAVARQKHLAGEFESTVDSRSAAEMYATDCRIPDEDIDNLRTDPDVAKKLNIVRYPIETMEEFDLRLYQMQLVFKKSRSMPISCWAR